MLVEVLNWVWFMLQLTTEFLKFCIVDNQEEVVMIVSLLNFSLLLGGAKRNWSHLV